MRFRRPRRAIVLSVLAGLLLAACGLADSAPPTPTLTPTATPSPTVTTPTMIPTITPAPTLTPTLPPLSAVAVVPESPLPTRTPPCPPAPPTRIIVGERGQVERGVRPLNIRTEAGITARILGRLEATDIFRVLEGPQCADGFVWYQVERIDGALRGWIAEGEPGLYYIAPYLPG